MMRRWRVTSLRAGADFHFSCRVVVLEKQPFRNTFGLLADGRGQVDRERERERESACSALIISSQLLYGRKELRVKSQQSIFL